MVSYETIYSEIESHLLASSSSKTSEITRCIKAFFRDRFQHKHTVLCSSADSSEYLVDVLVANFDPHAAIVQGTLDVLVVDGKALIAVESELGGTGGSSPYGVMKNVVEDYFKLLLIDAPYKVMFFTSLPFCKEIQHVERRIETLRQLYCTSNRLGNGILLIHLDGHQPISSQVQVLVEAGRIRGFVIESDGSVWREISACPKPQADGPALGRPAI